jgi:hypothetical protein
MSIPTLRPLSPKHRLYITFSNVIYHPWSSRYFYCLWLIKMIMDGVFASYISRLTDEYTKIENMSPKVKEMLLVDATFITEKLTALPGVRKMDQGLIQAVEAREVTVTKTMENGTEKSEDVLFDAEADQKVEGKEKKEPESV